MKFLNKRVVEIVYDEESFGKARQFIVRIDPPRTLGERIELARLCAAFHYQESRQLDAALIDATELAKAIQPLIPAFESVTGEERNKWQRVVTAIYRAADHADNGWRADVAGAEQSDKP